MLLSKPPCIQILKNKIKSMTPEKNPFYSVPAIYETKAEPPLKASRRIGSNAY